MYRLLLLLGLVVFCAGCAESNAGASGSPPETLQDLEKRVETVEIGLRKTIDTVVGLHGEEGEGDTPYVPTKISWLCVAVNSMGTYEEHMGKGYKITCQIHDRNTILVKATYSKSSNPGVDFIGALREITAIKVLACAEALGWNWLRVIQTTEATD